MGEASLRPVDEAGIEDDFLYHLYRGGELLAAGKNQEARDELERAFHLKPRNQKAQNLLGLVYFKLGLLERSAEVYEMLVQDNPTDPTLRVNLGLVHLKSGDHVRAIRELETAVDLSPEQQKPLNYLGLAYTQARQHGKALETFKRAGNRAMVEKVERALAAGSPATKVEPVPEPPRPSPARPTSEEPVPLPADGTYRRAVPSTPPPQPVQEDVGIEVEIDDAIAEDDGAVLESRSEPPRPAPPVPVPPVPQPAAAATEPALREAPAPPPPPPATPPAVSAEKSPPPLPIGALGELLHQAAPTLGPEQSTFHVDGDGALIRVRSDLHARLAGLCWLRGEMQRTPEQKRFRGRATDKPFGEGQDRLYALGGRGEIFVAARGLKAIEMGEEALYLLEDVLFAFEDGLSYENGRVSSPVPPDLFLVHLRGQGAALLRLGGELRSLPVRTGDPLVLPMDRLVGWTGGLTPSVLAELGAPAPGQPAPTSETPGRWLRLEGDGWALWTLPPK